MKLTEENKRRIDHYFDNNSILQRSLELNRKFVDDISTAELNGLMKPFDEYDMASFKATGERVKII